MPDADRVVYSVLSPVGLRTGSDVPETAAISDLGNAVIAQIWDYMFRGDDVFAYIREALQKRHPGVRFVEYPVFGNIHGPEQDTLAAAIPKKLRDNGCDAVMVGIGACGSCTPAVTRASVAAEAAGFPTVSIVATGFLAQAKATARALGVPNIRLVEFPGVPMTESPESIQRKVMSNLIQPLEEALMSAAPS